jgi:ethanolamine utilization protein EutM
MTENALGLIETVGLPTAIEAADAAMKAANVRLVGYEKTRGGGLVVVKIRGDVGAVRAAVEAAVISASKVGKINGYHVIPRPHEETEQLIDLVDRGPAAAPQPPILGEAAAQPPILGEAAAQPPILGEAAAQPPAPRRPSQGEAVPKALKPASRKRAAKSPAPPPAASPAEPPAESGAGGGVEGDAPSA